MSEQVNTGAESSFSSALESLFSDPGAKEQFEKIVQSLKENLPRNGDSSPAESETPPAENQPGDGLAAILSNPKLMESLPMLLSGMRPQPQPATIDKTPEDRRRDLLLALKPFLSKDRGNAVDMILQISRLGAVLRMIQ